MKAIVSEYELIARFAIDGNVEEVRRSLASGINYREAILYVSGFHQNREAEKFILEHATCKCGQIATTWKPEPKCANCGFHESIDNQIEYK